MIALIARAHLTPAASAAIDQLLKENPIDPSINRFCKDRPQDLMADVSTWADDAKNIEKTGAWHYVDIPLTVVGPGNLGAWCAPIGPSVDGKDRPGCITNALDYEVGILKDRDRPAADRAQALRYVIHFVGDIHQPLHDSDNDDRGGNCTALAFFAEERPANLHAIWDYKIIQRRLSEEKGSQSEYALMLDKHFGGHWSAAELKPDFGGWAWEGNALARGVTYGDLKPQIPVEQPTPQTDCNAERNKVAALHISIGDGYYNQTLPIVDEQLAKAGYRLAELLNETLR